MKYEHVRLGWRFKYTADFWAEMEIRVFDGKNRRIECFARNKFKTNVSSLHLNGCQGHQTVFSVSSVLRLMSSQVEGAHPTRFHFICTNPITPLLVASNLRNYLLYAFSIISIISKHTWYLSFFYTSKIFGEQNLHRKTPIFRVKSVKNANFSR